MGTDFWPTLSAIRSLFLKTYNTWDEDVDLRTIAQLCWETESHPVIDRDMISGLTGTGTGTENFN